MMRAKISGYLTLSSIVAFAYWLLDHSLPDLLPKLPKPVSAAIAICAGALLLAALAIMGGRRFLEWMPRPWLPRPFWRVGFWLRHRPIVSILTAAPKASLSPTGMMDECTVSLVLSRSLARLPFDAVVRFDAAMLKFRPDGGSRSGCYLFRPKEAGGYLARPMLAESSDSIAIEFAATGLPSPPDLAPDFSGDYKIEISGIIIDVQSPKPIIGKLPPARW